ncbi:hypothetical protein M422DRAFT_775413 [Sphaerobolus stellatus SS14]|nr:hypothetical protein M422DRAFT_775413 [Sphaerobolus stellatus SS14]
MTSNRPSFSSSRRPSSAIFIGGLPPPPSPPSSDIVSSSPHSQLPSPPATNSGSTGDSNSTSAGSIGRNRMVSSKRSSPDEDDDAGLDYDEDTTARLSGDIRKGKEKELNSSSTSTLQRVSSLTERNRKLLDRVSFITSPDSHSRTPLTSLSVPKTPSVRSRSPNLPNPNLSSSTSSSVASSSSRISFPGPSSLPNGSGSETERERPPSQARQFSNIDDATTTRRKFTQSIDSSSMWNERRSNPPSPSKPSKNIGPETSPRSPRKRPSANFTVIGSGRRTRTVSIQGIPDDDDESFSTLSRTSSVNKKSRAPLPREFRDRRSLDGRSVGEGSTSSFQNMQDRAQTASPSTALAGRGVATNGVGGTYGAMRTSPRRPMRASTVRESTKRSQRWSSVDEGSSNGNVNEDDGDVQDASRRQWRKTGSAESPLGGREGRSVVGEGLRAAGLTRRPTGEDIFAEGVPQRRIRLSGGLGSRPTLNGSRDADVADLRTRIARAGIGQADDRDRDTRTPATGVGSRFGTARNINSVLSNLPSRAATSLATYGDDGDSPRNAASGSRTYRSVLPERAPSRATQHERSRSSPLARAPNATQIPSSEHARLMLESLTMFETQLARIPTSSTAPDLTRIAHSVVQSANGLNNLLRVGNTQALESQIEAEVGDAPRMVEASEIWRAVGSEYRESLRVSDELVRTVTQLLLGVGRLVKEAGRGQGTGTDSPDVSVTSSRSSLEGSDKARPARRSTGLDGRQSTDFASYREARRSLDGAGTLRMSTSTTDTVRPPSLPLDDDGEETAREQNRSSALDRLTIRRMLTPRLRDSARASPISQDSPVSATQPSPSPLPRNMVDRDREPLRGLPPPLPSLPSESLLDRRGSTRRRSKFSNTSNTTVRGTGSIFSPVTATNPTTAISAENVNVTGEVSTSLRSNISSTLSGLQERDGRTRTLSAVSTSAGDSSSSSSSTRALRLARGRMSLDQSSFEATSPEHTQTTFAPTERRERRRTITDIMS